jgi:hypothetical protein
MDNRRYLTVRGCSGICVTRRISFRYSNFRPLHISLCVPTVCLLGVSNYGPEWVSQFWPAWIQSSLIFFYITTWSLNSAAFEVIIDVQFKRSRK